MKNLMLDIETLGTNNNAIITQIGACYFDRLTGEVRDTFEVNIDIQSSLDQGFTLDVDTLYWWLSIKEKASFIEEPRLSVEKALTDFNKFASHAKKIWSHATFDMPIVLNAYGKMKIKPSFHYTTSRDIRTLMDLADGKRSDIGEVKHKKTHGALDDCLCQVEYCSKYFNKLNNK